MDTFHWDVLVTYHRDVVGCFIWDLLETLWRRNDRSSCYVLLRRLYDVPMRRRGDAPLRRLSEVPLRRCWVFHLRRTCDVAGTYRETSLRRCHNVLMSSGFNSARKRLSHRYFSVNLEKFSGKLFCRTPPRNHFSHDVVFFFFCKSVRFAA